MKLAILQAAAGLIGMLLTVGANENVSIATIFVMGTVSSVLFLAGMIKIAMNMD